jgi:tetratricopeptide (TPR) repeat protein
LKKKYDEATRSCREAHELLTSDTAPELIIKVKLQLALSLTNQVPSGTRMYQNLNEVYAKLGQESELKNAQENHQSALKVLNEALEVSPKARNLLKAKIRMLNRLQNYDEALDVCDACLAVSEIDTPVIILKMTALYHLLQDAVRRTADAQEITGLQEQFDECKIIIAKHINDKSFATDLHHALWLSCQFASLLTRPSLLEQEQLRVRAQELTGIFTHLTSVIHAQVPDAEVKSSITPPAAPYSSLFHQSSDSGRVRLTTHAQLNQTQSSLAEIITELTTLEGLLTKKDASLLSYLDYAVIHHPADSKDAEKTFSVLKLVQALHQFSLSINKYEHRVLAQQCQRIIRQIQAYWQEKTTAFLNLSLLSAIQLLIPGASDSLPHLAIEPQSEFGKYYQELTANGPNDIKKEPPNESQHKPKYGVLAFRRLTHCSRTAMIEAVKEFGQKLGRIQDELETEEKISDADQKVLDDWRNDVREMFLGNPKFPNAYELYAAISCLDPFFKDENGSPQDQAKILLRFMEETRKSMCNAGQLLESEQTLDDYAKIAISTRGQYDQDSQYVLEGSQYTSTRYSSQAGPATYVTPSYRSGYESDGC